MILCYYYKADSVEWDWYLWPYIYHYHSKMRSGVVLWAAFIVWSKKDESSAAALCIVAS